MEEQNEQQLLDQMNRTQEKKTPKRFSLIQMVRCSFLEPGIFIPGEDYLGPVPTKINFKSKFFFLFFFSPIFYFLFIFFVVFFSMNSFFF